MRKSKQHTNNPDWVPDSRKKAVYNSTNTALIILWLGTLLLISYMIYHWQDGASDADRPKSARGIFVDDMLLNISDLKLDSSSLVNITLNKGGNEQRTSNIVTLPQTKESRKIIYNKILTQKLNRTKKNTSGGFDIKPLPE